jgi:hypothetical protein
MAPDTHALLVHTQVYENYAWGADGQLDTDRPYWKPKGGNDYLVTCATLDADSTALEQAYVLDRVRDQIEIDNGGFQESIIGWRVVSADFDPAAGEDDLYIAKWLRTSLTRITI